MLWIALAIVLVVLLLLPNWWVNRVLRIHSWHRDDYPGTGGEMARHLLDKLGLDSVGVESTASGDHYDPSAKSVRLTDDKLNGKSLTAVVVAAHEVGHALQHARGEATFRTRTFMAHIAIWMQRIAPLALMLAPLLVFLTPMASRISIMVAVAAMVIGTLVHLVTLPVEWDASFGKAMPLLEHGEYLDEDDMRNARKILKAAAFTYVSGALISMLNVGRWWRYLRG